MTRKTSDARYSKSLEWPYDQRRTKPYQNIKCRRDLSFKDTLLPDEELLHIHLGPVVYSEACIFMDALKGEKYRIHVEVDGHPQLISYHKLLRKTNEGDFSVRMCHTNPSKEFRVKHFYPGEYYDF